MQTGVKGMQMNSLWEGGEGKGPAPAAGFVEANGTTNGTTMAMNWSLVEANGTNWLFVEANGTNWSFVEANGTTNGTNWSLLQTGAGGMQRNWSFVEANGTING